ncbi:ATP-dependent helicase [Candidatus Collierbacteria bacterium]|nr:ATP-dependent helicase [Candidatus Collierbacteria bacterium]
MSPTPFQKTYSALNQDQKKAVDTIDGPVMVMAGPGTGKTQVLTVRIANILKKTDTDPSAILALTFTEAATREMRQRLINLIGKDGYSVRTTTFHAFCSDIINENPERFSRPAPAKGWSASGGGLTGLEKIEIITKILEDGTFLLLKPLNNPIFYLKDILGTISDLKREGITDKKYAKLVRALSEDFQVEGPSLKKTAFGEKEKLVQKNLDLLTIYQQYQKELKKRGRFDFEDMINWVVEAFESDEEFLLSYQEKFQYILVDEYQDTNSAQNRLLFALASYWGETANLFVVGDPNQSIFRFQGASQENIKQFDKHFPKGVKIFLTENYRSTQTLLSSAASLTEITPLKGNAIHEPHPIRVAQFNSSVFEDEYLVRSIKEKIENGTSPSDIAVIVKENRDLVHLADIMKQRNIPYRLEGGINVLTTPLVSQFIKILRVTVGISGSLDDMDLFTVLNYPYFNLDKFDLLKLARQAHTNRISLLDTLLSSNHSVVNQFVIWSHQTASHTLPEMFQTIFQESGLLNHILALPQPVSELNRFNTLYEDVKNQVAANPRLNLTGYVNNLTTMEDHQIKLDEEVLVSATPSVTLTTAHKAKGLEWLIVYIYRFADTHWGNKTNRQMIKLPDGILDSDLTKEDKNAEERRLFYVALTRAKREVHLSGATTYASSVKMVFPAMFLSDLPQKHLENIQTDAFEKDAVKILANLLGIPSEPTIHNGEEAFLKDLIANFKLSPTALNTFLQCHYKFKLDNLYRIPRAKAPAMCFGTAVHSALENLYKKLNKTGKLEKEADFIRDFETALKREVLSESELKDRLVHGRKILSAYYNHYQKEFIPVLFTERNFGHATPILLDDIALSGKSDRIDIINSSVIASDSEAIHSRYNKRVRFTDYKTGAPKTRGMLEKEGDGPDGNYKRQLTFYHLLADLDKSFGYKVTDTVLDFIEPDKTGAFHREHFNITPKEVHDLKNTIKDSVKEIRTMNFSRTTDTSICARCDFLSHCWPSGVPSPSK